MFLEELKHWSTYELALYALNKDNLLQINNRVSLSLSFVCVGVRVCVCVHASTYELALYALNKDNLSQINNRVSLSLSFVCVWACVRVRVCVHVLTYELALTR